MSNNTIKRVQGSWGGVYFKVDAQKHRRRTSAAGRTLINWVVQRAHVAWVPTGTSFMHRRSSDLEGMVRSPRFYRQGGRSVQFCGHRQKEYTLLWGIAEG